MIGPRRGLALALVAVAALAVATSGCGYRLAGRGGSTSFLPDDIEVIGIPPLANETDRSQLEQRITESLVDEFLQRGRFETVPGSVGADAVLEGTIASYRTDPVTFTEQGRFDRVEVTITARMRLVRRSPETVLWSQNQYIFREQYDVPETPFSEIDRDIVALEEIAREFARAVVTSILEEF